MLSAVEGQRGSRETPFLETARLRLSVPGPDDGHDLFAYALRNQEHLAPWSPPPPPDWNTLENAMRRARSYREQAMAGACFRFWARMKQAPHSDFVAAVTLSQIVLGARRACSLGYHVDARHQGQGFVTEAARAVIEFAFERLLLNRIEASYVPHNERSARVLQRLGFVVEGYARHYLFVDGCFRDHQLVGLVNPSLGDAAALCTPMA